MSGELHEGVVAFRPLTPGREQIVLGRVQVGEISPSLNPVSRFPVCYRLDLPDNSSRAWQPARDVADARRQDLEKINDWMIAAGVRPVGGANV
jgi:hypothetical protein